MPLGRGARVEGPGLPARGRADVLRRVTKRDGDAELPAQGECASPAAARDGGRGCHAGRLWSRHPAAFPVRGKKDPFLTPDKEHGEDGRPREAPLRAQLARFAR